MKKMIKIGLLVLGLGWPAFVHVQDDEQIDDISMEQRDDVDINRKSKECKVLVLNAIAHLKKVSLESACNDFIHNVKWREGELFVFVFRSNGVCLAHGDDYDMIWKNIKDIKGIGGAPLIKNFNIMAKKGGRLSYLWANSFKESYVKSMIKDGVSYIIGCGFYPESDSHSTKQLVRQAIAYFKQHGKDATFAHISNPNGPFVKGDIYLGAYNFKGLTLAHGNNPALVGQMRIDEVDARGKPLVKELIRIARTKGSGWIEYFWRKEFKRAYVEKVVDPKTKVPFLITAGYYPNINFKAVKSYANRAIRYLKAHGAKEAFSEFSNLVGEFAQGGLGVVVYNHDGKCLANGENPAFVGQNLLKIQDQEGRFYVKDIMKAAKKYEKTIVSYQSANANAVAYVHRVETPDGKFIITVQFFPASKLVTTQTLVNRAIETLNENQPAQAFAAFSTKDSPFVRGDLHIFAYDVEGTRLVNGLRKSQIWHNMLKSTDQLGKAVVDDIITIALNGGGWYEYKARNATRKVYVKAVEKTMENKKVKNFIVGSGYFL